MLRSNMTCNFLRLTDHCIALMLLASGIALLAPSAAFGANECGDPEANGAAADTFVCSGNHAAVTYGATNGTLQLQLQDGLVVTDGGITITPSGNNNLVVRYAPGLGGPADPSITNLAGAGIQTIRTTAGSLTFSLNDNDDGDTPMVISGTTAGVLLRNVDAGGISFSTSNAVISASNGAGFDIGNPGSGSFRITNGSGGSVTGSTYAARLSSGGSASFTNNGVASGGLGAILFEGVGLDIYNSESGVLNGSITANATGLVDINSRGVWTFSGTSFLGDGETILNTEVNSLTNIGRDAVASTLDFGAGNDEWTSFSVLAVGGGTEGAALLRVVDLETWFNEGAIVFGADASLNGTDGVPNDRIVVTGGTTFTGSNGSRLLMDANLGAAGQADCSAAVVADCFDLRGQATAGETAIIVNNVGGMPGVANTGIVLVDVNGGSSAAGHFLLSSASSGWKSNPGSPDGLLDMGLFVYDLAYDEDSQRHLLVSSPDVEALEFDVLGAAAHAVWETTTGSWFNRQVDLRDSRRQDGGRSGAGTWLKLSDSHVDRTNYQSYDISNGPLKFNTSYQQAVTALVGGVDLMSAGGAFVVGITGGWVDSTVKFQSSPTDAKLDGFSLGAYASYIGDAFFFDAILNANQLDLEHNSPTIGLTGLAGQVDTLGFQAEMGLRVVVPDSETYLEPVLTLAYTTASLGRLAVGEAAVSLDDAKSFRAAVGGRIVGRVPLSAVDARFAFTGRIWEELEGENRMHLTSNGQGFSYFDDNTGTLGEVGLGLTVRTLDGRMSAFFDGGARFRDAYVNTTLSLGVRYHW